MTSSLSIALSWLSLSLLSLSGVAAGQSAAALWRTDDGSIGKRYGFCVSATGDLTGDGLADVVVGADWFDASGGKRSGRAYAYRGLDGSRLYTWDGEAAYDYFGAAGGAGDVDGDGVGDVVVGAYGYDGPAGFNTGKAYVFRGSDGSLLHSWTGTSAFEELGSSVAGAGDVDGDGFDDVILGGHRGTAYVRSGATGGLLHTLVVRNEYLTVAAAGDVDGDGFDDVIVGNVNSDARYSSDPGHAVVFSGRDGSKLHGWNGESGGDAFGSAVSGLGDVDGDGLADVAVGAPYHRGAAGSDTGKAYVYAGASGKLIRSREGEAAFDSYGTAVSGAVDFDGDGVDDVVVGAYAYEGPAGPHQGKAYVYAGALERELTAWRGDGGFSGFAVAGGGPAADVDGDGFGDVFLGSESSRGTRSGEVYAYLGGAVDATAPAEHAQDPLLEDSAGTLGLGPRIGSTSQPFNVLLYCWNAVQSGPFLIEIRSARSAQPVTASIGFLYLTGQRLALTAGTHARNARPWSATDVVLPLDPSLIGLTYHVGGFCAGYATGGRTSNLLSQTIGG